MASWAAQSGQSERVWMGKSGVFDARPWLLRIGHRSKGSPDWLPKARVLRLAQACRARRVRPSRPWPEKPKIAKDMKALELSDTEATRYVLVAAAGSQSTPWCRFRVQSPP